MRRAWLVWLRAARAYSLYLHAAVPTRRASTLFIYFSYGYCQTVINGVISDHTAHYYSSLVSICDYFLGCLLDSTDVLYVVLTPQNAPEEVVTDGYEGAIIMCRVVREDPFLHD
jgi:hypothetical protein